jgi:hypothetical protein
LWIGSCAIPWRVPDPLTALLFFLSHAGVVALALTYVFAWTKGGRPERYGAAVSAAAWTVLQIAMRLGHDDELSFMISDGLVAAGFLVLAVRYARLWLGVALMLQAALFALHASRLGGDPATDWIGRLIPHWAGSPDQDYRLFVQLIRYGGLGVLVWASAASWAKRSAAARPQSSRS